MIALTDKETAEVPLIVRRPPVISDNSTRSAVMMMIDDDDKDDDMMMVVITMIMMMTTPTGPPWPSRETGWSSSATRTGFPNQRFTGGDR